MDNTPRQEERGHTETPEQSRASPRTPHPWEQHYPPGVAWDLPIIPTTLPALLEDARARSGQALLIDYRDRHITFEALAVLVDRLAAGLLAGGYGGRTIALFLPNTPWHSVCFFAALKAGARLVHLSPLDAPREIVFKLTDSGAELVITTDLGGLALAAAKLVEGGLVQRMMVGEDAYWGGPEIPGTPYGEAITRLESLLLDRPPTSWPEIKPGDIALLQYTGGTTGMPKGAMLSHANMTAATAIYHAWREETTPPSGTQRVIGVLPMFHIYALGVVLLLNIADGNEILLRPRFDLATTLRDIEEKRATAFPAVPTMLIALLSAPGIETRDFSSLSSVGSGGAPLAHETGQRLEKIFRQPIRSGWGMTETAAAGTRIPPGAAPRPGLIGVPLSRIELRIVSLEDPSRVLLPGEVGEIAVRGPNVFSGYWNQAALSAQCFADGFFLTGDIGTMDETGLFAILDRKKRMIISGGFNVYPSMIENAIHEHPDVLEVIVIGVPDAYRGEAAKAFVVLRAGAAPLELETLRDFLSDKLGRHELPSALELRDSLPKSPVGKLLATQLADEERARCS